jgi:succinyl-diaminopimelate desuccinylase
MSFQDSFDEVNRYVDARREDLVALCARLVEAESVNPPGETTRVAVVLEEFLGGHGIALERAAKVAHKPNLIGVIEGTGPGPHLVFNGHMDTIAPGDQSAWSVPIHAQTRKEGRLYGHGMGNMKGADAALALATAFLAEHRAHWRGRITYTAVADETVFGPDGTGYLLEVRPDLLADAVICGEGPGDMGLALAEKGLVWIELRATGGSGQGMLATRGSAPTAALAAALAEIDTWNEVTVAPPAEVACLAEHAGDHGLRLSANIGVIEGGRFVSQTAREARAEIDFRVPPGLALGEIEGRLDDLCAKASGLSWRRIKGWEANWSGIESPVVAAVAEAAGRVRGQPAKPVVRLPASDASRWRALGIPGICYGPQPTLAAGVDDYAEEQDVVDCAKVYALAALEFLGAADEETPT